VWLAWLAVPLYWIHQFEEYSLPVLGFDYSIQEMIARRSAFRRIRTVRFRWPSTRW
jgi:hypothetical protein